MRGSFAAALAAAFLCGCAGLQVGLHDSGVVVVPQEHAVEIANRSVDVAEREDRIREEIKRGATLSSVQELERWEQVR